MALDLNCYFDPSYAFTEANVPGLLAWANAFSHPTAKGADSGWAVTAFSRQNLESDNCIEVYSESNQTAFAVKFLDLPESGNVGTLEGGRIDAVRFRYVVPEVAGGGSVSFSYQTLTLSLTSYPQLKDPYQMEALFGQASEAFAVQSRNYQSIIADNHIGFIVYDASQFDPAVLGSGRVQLVYASSEYVVLKVEVDG